MMTELMPDTCKTVNICVGFQPTTLSLASSRQCCRSAKLKSARLRYKDDPCPVHNSIHAHAAGKIAHVAATFHHIDA